MALTDRQERQVEIDERLDAEETVERRYEGSIVEDVIFAPVDALAGTKSSTEIAREKQDYYNELRESRERR